MKRVMTWCLLAMLATTASAQWEYDTHEDLMTDTVRHLISVASETSQGTLRDARLVARTEDGVEWEVYIYWGGWNIDSDTRAITVRLGSSAPRSWHVNLSTDREALFFRDPSDFLSEIQALDPGGKLVAQAPRILGSVMTARWDVTGVTAAMEAVKAAIATKQ